MTDPFIRLDRVSKAFGGVTVVDDLDLTIGRGEFVSLLGPSGSGKTTILMMLAGFESPTAGTVSLDGARIDRLPPHRRNMGVVFQSYALFPHRTVAENVAFPLRMRGMARPEVAGRVARALDMVQLGAFADRKPAQLSGGQQQRVALARALVFEPAVVLMDEPLGALDKQLREQMQLDIRDIHRRLGLTIVFVTHDQGEALTMSDRVAVFNKGRIEQIATPREIYDHPRTRFVAEFLGETNLIDGVVDRAGAGTATIRVADGTAIEAATHHALASGEAVTVSLRPERLRLSPSAEAPNALPAAVADSVYHGDHIRVRIDAPTGSLIARTPRGAPEWDRGARTFATFAPGDCWVLPR
ncbi:ABC transporter ATP-binding protein [Methylobacterium nonmethylotrophicum]|uniref:Spermidine/putrescine import ATP-binding protein PotA n=1 Tax=Methylobacterium nonmethylotrophicum TaxID=1141884 RepID=A0A4Z0NTU0_9HYPH|nr:ABC transporter ATP-binding protein [Methylobacterium nonmethylotrophicum]TGE00314.1 ABC transporter ATP-binding protein [Methylobacterium nonmethylotrophicum]